MTAQPLFAILHFLDGIGIPVEASPLEDSLLPGVTVRRGTIIYDPDTLRWPGDLLHEAGHIAVTDPQLRDTIETIGNDPAEEMAATAWSYAAALAAGIDPALVLHAGFKGGGPDVLENFNAGRYFGVPILQWFGMTAEPHQAETLGIPAYPHMTRWLRQIEPFRLND